MSQIRLEDEAVVMMMMHTYFAHFGKVVALRGIMTYQNPPSNGERKKWVGPPKCVKDG